MGEGERQLARESGVDFRGKKASGGRQLFKIVDDDDLRRTTREFARVESDDSGGKSRQ
jgi:hypothetical protein